MASTETTGLERELEALLDVEKFDPPEEFRKQALWNDPTVYEEAEADSQGWWAGQAEELLDWSEPWDRCSTTPTRRSTSGSWAARSTPPTTASTATSRPDAATGSRSTGAARRARSATSPTPTFTATCSSSPTR